MSAENSQNRSDLKAQLDLLESLEAGLLDSLKCPSCCKSAVSVWFTNPIEGEYRTWFVCKHCDFESRVQDSSRPQYFSLDRIDKRREQYDLKLLQELKFPFGR